MVEVVLKYFKLRVNPFCLTPDTKLYCNLPIYEETINAILFSLAEGNSIILVNGEVGLGKTMLCRKLLDFLDENFQTIFIPQPNVSERALLNSIVAELGIDINPLQDPYPLINARLLENAKQHKKTILIIDEAQTISDKSLEKIRLLTNLETASERLLQIVLFAQPELKHRLAQNKLRPLAQRIIQHCDLQPLSFEHVGIYLRKKLIRAGCLQRTIFGAQATKLLWKKSKGVPRLINILAYKAMLSAFARGKVEVQKKDILLAAKESDVPLLGVAHTKKTGKQFKENHIIISLIAITMGLIIILIFALKKYGLL